MSEKYVSEGIVGELIIEEMDEWRAGICTVKRLQQEKGPVLTVFGEHGVPIGTVKTYKYTKESVLFDGANDVADLAEITHRVNQIIKGEYDRL